MTLGIKKEEMRMGKRIEEQRINGIIKGKIGRSEFYPIGMDKEVARVFLWNFLELRHGNVGFAENPPLLPSNHVMQH